MSRFNLSALAVRERSITLFLIVAIILSGVYAFLRLGRAEDPAFVIKTLTVRPYGLERQPRKCRTSSPNLSRNGCRSCVGTIGSRRSRGPASL